MFCMILLRSAIFVPFLSCHMRLSVHCNFMTMNLSHILSCLSDGTGVILGRELDEMKCHSSMLRISFMCGLYVSELQSLIYRSRLVVGHCRRFLWTIDWKKMSWTVLLCSEIFFVLSRWRRNRGILLSENSTWITSDDIRIASIVIRF